MTNNRLSLEELTRLGRKFYLEELKDTLEKDFMGQFAIIDVEQKKYVVDEDRLAAIEKAQKEFGEKLFYIVHIGSLRNTNSNFSPETYAWKF